MKGVKVTCLGAILLLIGCGDDSPSIHKWNGVLKETETYSYIISNPPLTQSELVSFIIDYIKRDPNTPLDFLNGERGISFYKESNATPLDGNRPEASWWEQPFTDPAIKYKEIDVYEIAVVNFFKKNNSFRVYLQWEYRKTCQARKSGIVEIRANGIVDTLCD
ncbi:MAG: hypothetical protein ACRDC8_17205 [Aeromonas veronii]